MKIYENVKAFCGNALEAGHSRQPVEYNGLWLLLPCFVSWWLAWNLELNHVPQGYSIEMTVSSSIIPVSFTGVLHNPFPSVTSIYKFAAFVEVFACVLCRLEFVIRHIGLNVAWWCFPQWEALGITRSEQYWRVFGCCALDGLFQGSRFFFEPYPYENPKVATGAVITQVTCSIFTESQAVGGQIADKDRLRRIFKVKSLSINGESHHSKTPVDDQFDFEFWRMWQ